MADFHQFLKISLMKFIIIGPAYIRGGQEGWGIRCWWQRLKQRSKKTQMVEFRVAMKFTCIHKWAIFPISLDRRILTMEAILILCTVKLEPSIATI